MAIPFLRTSALLVLVPFAAAVSSGCEDDMNRVLTVTATGSLAGTVFLDVNGDRAFNSADQELRGITVQLVAAGSRQVVASAVTRDNGVYFIENVPVGSYNVRVDPAILGDSLQAVYVTDSQVTLLAGENQTEVIALTYPRVSVAEVRRLPVGRRVFVEGVALNNQRAFSDASVHIRADSGYLRLLGVPTRIEARDSVRFQGRVGTSNGQPVLTEVLAFRLGEVSAIEPVAVTTQQAATADGGRLDAALVRVARATIQDTATVAEDAFLTLNDGSGPVTLVVDREISFNRRLYVPGTVVNAVGVLVPVGAGGTWVIRATGSRDLAIAQ